MLRTQGLNFVYPLGERLTFPDLRCNDGEHCLILGQSGCGKTTLLHLIAGLRAVQSGSIVLNDTEDEGEDHEHEADHNHDADKEHNHEDHDHDHDASLNAIPKPLFEENDTAEITSLLIKFKALNFQTLNMQRNINENTYLQA